MHFLERNALLFSLMSELVKAWSSPPLSPRPVSCVEARVHSGLGNWLYIAVEAAAIAVVLNATLTLPNLLHDAFYLPTEVQRPGKASCRIVRSMQAASADETVRATVATILRAPDFQSARMQLFGRMFGAPRMSSLPTRHYGTAVHIRVVSDEVCHTYRSLRECSSSCVRFSSLRCVVRQAIPPVLVLSDSRAVGVRLIALLRRCACGNSSPLPSVGLPLGYRLPRRVRCSRDPHEARMTISSSIRAVARSMSLMGFFSHAEKRICG